MVVKHLDFHWNAETNEGASAPCLSPCLQVVFVSTCRSFWDCGSVALDDISVKLGDCELTAGNNLNVYSITCC